VKFSFFIAILFAGFHVHADLAQCQKTAKKSVDDCNKKATETKTNGDLASNQAYQNCITTEQASISNCASDLAGVGADQNAALAKSVSACYENKNQCKTDCDSSKAKNDKEKPLMKKQLDDCGKTIDQIADQMKKAQPEAQGAKDGGTKTSQASGTQPQQAAAAPPAAAPPAAAPPAAAPPAQQQPTNPTTPDAGNTNPATPATAASGDTAAAPAADPSVGFTQPKQCAEGATDVAGCKNTVAGAFPESGTAAVPYANSPFMPTTSSAGASGGSSGGGGGGSMSGAAGGTGAKLDPKISQADVLKALAGKKEGGSLGADSGGGGFSYNGGASSHSSLEDLFTSRNPASANKPKPGTNSAPKIVTADAQGTKLFSQEAGIHQVSKVVGDMIRCHFKSVDCVKN
jgi:hypothetical protein